mgnify:CR=1 FL=1
MGREAEARSGAKKPRRRSRPARSARGCQTPAVANPGCQTPAVANPGCQTPAVANPGCQTPAVANPGCQTPAVANPRCQTPATPNGGCLSSLASAEMRSHAWWHQPRGAEDPPCQRSQPMSCRRHSAALIHRPRRFSSASDLALDRHPRATRRGVVAGLSRGCRGVVAGMSQAGRHRGPRCGPGTSCQRYSHSLPVRSL